MSSANKIEFVPLGLALIDEGRFAEQVDQELLALQRDLMAYREKWPNIESAKAELTVTVKLAYDEKKLGDSFIISADVKCKTPAPPANVTMATPGEDQTDQPCLFVSRSGSRRDSPRQKIFLTEDGRTIDPETGEVID